jgi:hypothetical protein
MKKPITLRAALTVPCAAMAEVQVSDSYARAVPPSQPNSAVFLILKNTGEVPLEEAGAFASRKDAVRPQRETRGTDEDVTKLVEGATGCATGGAIGVRAAIAVRRAGSPLAIPVFPAGVLTRRSR